MATNHTNTFDPFPGLPDPATIDQVAEATNKSRRTVVRWIQSGELRAFKLGKSVYIPKSAVTEMCRPVRAAS